MQLSGAAESRQALDLSSRSAALQTTAILQGNAKRLGDCIDSDVIVEPVRAPFIPGFAAVKAAAKKAGGFLQDQRCLFHPSETDQLRISQDSPPRSKLVVKQRRHSWVCIASCSST